MQAHTFAADSATILEVLKTISVKRKKILMINSSQKQLKMHMVRRMKTMMMVVMVVVVTVMMMMTMMVRGHF